MRHEREDFFFVPIAKWRDNIGASHFFAAKYGHRNKNGDEKWKILWQR